MTLPLLLITGATGFVGSHVLQQALEAGYPVRVTARPAKVDALRKLHGNKVEVTAVADIAAGDYTEALKGVGAIIHLAASLPNDNDPKGVISAAIDGSINILTQAAAAGIKKIVVTSSWVATPDFDNPSTLYSDYEFTEKDWNPATKEQALDGTRNAFWIYSAAKTVAEHEIWKFGDTHPEIDITTINPPFIFGPFAPGTADLNAGTNSMFYHTVLPKTGGSKFPAGPQNPPPITVDVRDVAKAHILALPAPPSTEVGQKRLLVSGPNFSWKDAIEHLAVVRPDLRKRLPDTSEATKFTIASVNTGRARDVLGLTSYIDWKKTVEDAIDSFLEAEKRDA